MEKTESPLKKYRRQPKLYLNIPSNGKWYDQKTVAENTYTNLAVFSMTASDEILFKTPGALIHGDATANNISSLVFNLNGLKDKVSINTKASISSRYCRFQ